MTDKERSERTHEAMKHWANLPEDRLRAVMSETIFALFNAVEDLDAFGVKLHPADIIDKHLCRGNIVKDGDW